MKNAKVRLTGGIRLAFLRGIVIIVPLVLTFWVFQALLNSVDGILSPIFDEVLGRKIPGLGFISMVLLVLIVGLLTKNLIGRIILKSFERFIVAIPVVRSVYSAVRDLVGAFVTEGKGTTFRQVVMVQYPRQGLYCIGFVTNETTLVRGSEQIEFINVYFPHPPNPTSGVLIMVPRHEVIPLEMTIEQGLKLVLSGGIVTPKHLHVRPQLDP